MLIFRCFENANYSSELICFGFIYSSVTSITLNVIIFVNSVTSFLNPMIADFYDVMFMFRLFIYSIHFIDAVTYVLGSFLKILLV